MSFLGTQSETVWGSFSTIAFSFPRPSTIPFWTNLLVMSNDEHLRHTWIWETEVTFKIFNKYHPKSIKLRPFECCGWKQVQNGQWWGISFYLRCPYNFVACSLEQQWSNGSRLLLFLGFEPSISVNGTTPWSYWQLQMSINLKFLITNCQFRQIKDKSFLP